MTSPGGPTRHGWPVQLVALATFLAVCLGAAALGAAWTYLSVGDWYETLEKPSWNPPNWVFGPVWTTLYVMMAFAAWTVWRSGGREARLALVPFAVQLALNAAWSGVFFGLRRPGLAFAEVLLLWGAILVTVVAFRRVSAVAAALLLPYLAWVSFAAVLNGTIWRLNA